jgi:hypothetical protein
MSDNAGTLTVDDLNMALRLLRRIFRRAFLIFAVGIIATIVLNWISHQISEYGVRIADASLPEWALMATLVVMIAELYSDGRKVGRVFQDPLMMWLPALGLMSAGAVVAQKAALLRMRPGMFFRPLRPKRQSLPLHATDCRT